MLKDIGYFKKLYSFRVFISKTGDYRTCGQSILNGEGGGGQTQGKKTAFFPILKKSNPWDMMGEHSLLFKVIFLNII